ncbi:hypothetical protein TKK_0006481 [Trichogramma kaykai]
MPPRETPNQSGQKSGSNCSKVGKRYVLSARAQAALTFILEDIIEKTLEDARRLAESAGKSRVELAEIEQALRRLCEHYHTSWASESSIGLGERAAKAASSGESSSASSSKAKSKK